MVGLFFGAYVFGGLADKIGRKPSVIIGILTCALAQLLCGVAQNYGTYVVMRFLTAVGKCRSQFYCFYLISALTVTLMSETTELGHF